MGSIKIVCLKNMITVRISLRNSPRRFQAKIYKNSIISHSNLTSEVTLHRSLSDKSGVSTGQAGAEKSKPNQPIDNVVSSSTTSLMKMLPRNAQPYAELARFDKPIGTVLLLWPCLWSTALASGANIINTSLLTSIETKGAAAINDAYLSVAGDPYLLALFAAGSFLMRGAGCTINDMWDTKFDQKVKRTAARPLASGALSYRQATGFLGLQLTSGLGVLLSMPQEHLEYCFWLGSASLPLVAAYPLMKRYTNWPQLVLGATFNWGCFMGWAATHGNLDLSVVLPLYGGGIAWTLVYDTLYAHQDKDDDAKLGLKSTALHFAESTKPILLGFSMLATGSWILAGYNLGYTEPYYYLGCFTAGTHLFWQVLTADLDDPKNLADRFKSNADVGAIMFASCIAGNITSIL